MIFNHLVGQLFSMDRSIFRSEQEIQECQRDLERATRLAQDLNVIDVECREVVDVPLLPEKGE